MPPAAPPSSAAAGPAAASGPPPAAVAPPPPADKKPRKPRTTNPGVRVQGGRIYDSENGTTCHQVRGGGGGAANLRAHREQKAMRVARGAR